MRAERELIIQKLFGKVGKGCWIESPFNCDYGYNIEVGENFYTNTNCCILDCGKVTIGNNVWIGGGVTILGGVKIGANSVIGAGSVVVKDIPEGVVAVGNPAKAIRKITDADRVENYRRK